MDGQNYDSQDRASIAVSCGKNGSPYAIGPLSCLSVTLVHCGQTVGRIKMKFGIQVGLGHGHTVLDGDRALPTKRGIATPTFEIYGRRLCQTTVWIKMKLGMDVGLGLRQTVLNGDPAPLPQRGTAPSHQKNLAMSVVAKRLDGSRCSLVRR